MPPTSTSSDQRLAWITHVLPTVAYVGVIFYTGLVRVPRLPEVVGFIPTDKLLHALVFAGLALLLARAERTFWLQMSTRARLTIAVFAASFVGALLEVCQSIVPYRSAEFLDWLADTLGAICAAGLIALFLQLVPRRAHG